jgi:hypothetical protein
MEIPLNANISTYARRVNQEIHRKRVCHKDTAVLRKLYALITAAVNAECLDLKYRLYSLNVRLKFSYS